MIRGLVLPVLAVVFGLPLAGQAPDVLGFVQSNCAGCPNGTAKSGGLDVTALRAGKTFESDRKTWENVAQKLTFGEMPPPGVPRPPAQTIAEITAWLKSETSGRTGWFDPKRGE